VNPPGVGGNILYRLAANIIPLDQLGPDADPAHELGIGLPTDVHWVFRHDRVTLPREATVFAGLRELIEEPIEALPEADRERAWRALLQSPAVGLLLPGVDRTELLSLGRILPDAVDATNVRHILLARAVASSTPVLAGGVLSNEPVVGVLRLIVEVNPRTGAVTQLWAVAKWCARAAMTLEALEPVADLLDSAVPMTEAQTRRRRKARPQPTPAKKSMVLVLPLPGASESEDSAARLTRTASMAGFTLTIRRIKNRDGEATRRLIELLREDAPSVLLVADAVKDYATEAVKTYRAAIQAPRHFDLAYSESFDMVMDRFRQRLCALAGVSDNHLMLSDARPIGPAPTATLSATRDQAQPPVKRIGRQRIHSTWGTFTEDAETELWYARDRAGHGNRADELGPVGQFKRFRASATGLHCEGTVDENDRLLNDKHESTVGMFIPWSDLPGK
jgi:hypothetical protein